MDSEGKKREGAQIDLVIDRRDQTINLCEMKFSMKPFEITPSYLEHIIYRRELFRETTGTSKALHLTFVTTYGVAKNAQYGMIQSEITMDDLFTPDFDYVKRIDWTGLGGTPHPLLYLPHWPSEEEVVPIII